MRGSTITIDRSLAIMPSNKILIPGCEPMSTVSSTRMAMEMRKSRPFTPDELDAMWWREYIRGRSHIWTDAPTGPPVEIEPNADMDALESGDLCVSLIDLATARELIPGARVVNMQNFGGAYTHKLFVLPSQGVNCPCSDYVDYYAILRGASTPATQDELDDILDECDAFDVSCLQTNLRTTGGSSLNMNAYNNRVY